jgi:putative transposase
MANSNAINIKNPDVGTSDILTNLIKRSAREMISCAVETELNEFLTKHKELLSAEGKQRIVRNGFLPERQIVTGIGAVDVTIPRVRDRGDKQQEKITFESKIVPKHLRRSSSMEELLPLLYLKGISTNDFGDVLQPLLGKGAKNISAGVVSKLKSSWEEEYNNWRKIDLTNKNYIYFWADGIYLQARMEAERNCILVIIGVTPEGNKELVGLEIGYRESKDSWKELLLDLQARGLATTGSEGI